MSSFEENKEKYLNRVSENIEMLELMGNNSNNKLIELLIDPKDDKQLIVADCNLRSIQDLTELSKAVKAGRIKKIPFKENDIFKSFVALVKMVYNGEEIDNNNIYNSNKTGKEYAREIFYFISSFAGNIEEIVNYIMDELNISSDNIYGTIKLCIAMNEVQSRNQELQLCNITDFDNISDADVKNVQDFSNELHDLCRKNIIKSKPVKRFYLR